MREKHDKEQRIGGKEAKSVMRERRFWKGKDEEIKVDVCEGEIR